MAPDSVLGATRDPLDPEQPPEPPKSCPADLTHLKARLFRARATLVEASPFLGSLVLKVPLLITEDPRVATACVDGRGICYFGKDFLEALRDSWREKLLEAAEQALQRHKGIGNLLGWAQKLLGPLLNPQIPWQVKLAQKIHGHLKGRRRTFSRPGRRSQAVGAVLPGPIKDRGPVGGFVDVSGSVGPSGLGAFMGELVGILQNADFPVRLGTTGS